MDEEYLEAVLDVVALVPPGRVMTYGTIAETVADALAAAGGRPRGGPRQVGTVLSRAGGGVPWWRVVDAAGRPPAAHAARALDRLRAEGAPLRPDGDRVDVRRAVWWPPDPADDATHGTAGDARPGAADGAGPPPPPPSPGDASR